MDAISSQSRKRKAEDETSPEDSSASHPPLRPRKNSPYQLAGKLDNLSLFKMAITQHVDGYPVMDSSAVRLLLAAVRSRPERWHDCFIFTEKRLQKLASQKGVIRARNVYVSLSYALEELEQDLIFIQERSAKAPDDSTQTWWSLCSTGSLVLRLRELSGLDETFFVQHPINLLLFRVVKQISQLDDLGPNAAREDTFWKSPIEEDEFGECDEAASALRYQMLRLLLFYERHNDYIRFFRKIVHDLKTIVER